VAGGAVARLRGSRELATAVTCGLVVASHIVLDWLGRDSNTPRGVMAFWPISRPTSTPGSTCSPRSPPRYWKPDEFILQNAVSVAPRVADPGSCCRRGVLDSSPPTRGRGPKAACSGVSEPRLPTDQPQPPSPCQRFHDPFWRLSQPPHAGHETGASTCRTLPALAPQVPGGDHALQQGTGAVLRIPSPSWSTPRIARHTSRPMKSASVSGPMG